jgi:SAM-dependent methyltransferase
MAYCNADSDFDAVVRHLRNKNLDLYPTRWSPMLKVIERLSRGMTKLRLRVLRTTGWQAVVSERIVEEALILRHIRPEDRRVLDFGAYESLFPLTLSALGHEVMVLDQRPYPFKAPRLTNVTADLFKGIPLPAESFDLVISISTIEHLGLGTYDDVQIPDGDRLGVERLWRLVRPGGRLMATVPAGRPGVQRGYRTYDEARLRTVFPGLVTTQWFSKDHRAGAWSPSTADAVRDRVYGEPHGRLPVEAVAFIICEKS